MKCATRLILLTIFVFTPLVSQAQQFGFHPQAVLPESHHRFGSVLEGDTVRHTFVLQNKGVADLVIERIKSG
jgi:hypothetical protein